MIGPIGGMGGSNGAGRRASSGSNAYAESGNIHESRALVPVEPRNNQPRNRSREQSASRAEAALVCHLLAMEAGDRQTRVKRRRPADEAALAYAQIAERPADQARARPTRITAI